MSGRIWASGQLSTSPHYLRTKLQDLEVLQHFSIYTLLLKIPITVVPNYEIIMDKICTAIAIKIFPSQSSDINLIFIIDGDCFTLNV